MTSLCHYIGVWVCQMVVILPASCEHPPKSKGECSQSSSSWFHSSDTTLHDSKLQSSFQLAHTLYPLFHLFDSCIRVNRCWKVSFIIVLMCCSVFYIQHHGTTDSVPVKTGLWKTTDNSFLTYKLLEV
jgi:hypothetical protein